VDQEDRLDRAEREHREAGIRVMAQFALLDLFRRRGHCAATAEARAMLDTVQAAFLLARQHVREERIARGLEG
jgi:hypothetical protein